MGKGIIVVYMMLVSFITAVYLHRQDFLNDILWCLPAVSTLSIIALFEVDEYSREVNKNEQARNN